MMRFLLPLLVVLSFVSPASAQYAPRAFELKADNDGPFVAYFDPGKNGSGMKLQVFSGDRKTGSLLWEVDLPQRTNSWALRLSPDGQYAITSGDVERTEKNVPLLIFNSKGLVKDYDLEQLTGQKLDDIRKAGAWSSGSGAGSWNNNTAFIFDFADNHHWLVMHIWWSEQWVIVDLDSGQLVPVTDAMKARLLKLGLEYAIANRKVDAQTMAAFTLLKRDELQPEGRKRIEELLEDPSFSGFRFQSPNAAPPTADTGRFVAYSYVRERAGSFLANWDNLSRIGDSKNLYLANVRGQVHLGRKPTRGDKSVTHIFLVPADRDVASWSKPDLPTYAIKIDNDEAWRGKRVNGSDIIRFQFQDLNPGKYWLKVVHDFNPPAGPTGSPGDLENEKGEILDLKKGEGPNVGTIECATPIEL